MTPPDPDKHLPTQSRRDRELLILNSIARALNREVDLNAALHRVLAEVADHFGLETGWIFLASDDDAQNTYLAAAQNLPPALAESPASLSGSCHCLKTYRAGDLSGAANVNIIECSRLAEWMEGTQGLQYHASIPLYSQERQHKLGVMNVASRDWRELDSDDLQLLYIVGDLLGIAIERARLFERSVQMGALEERNRLAREIHDTLAQGLSAIALHLETADALLESAPNGADTATLSRIHKAVSGALGLTRANLEEARRSVLDLRAAPLEGRPLPVALAELAGAHQAAFSVTGDARPLSSRLETGLYRIAQEALNNVHQHAAASHTRVTLQFEPAHLRLTIEDNGRGFDPASLNARSGHFGLIGLLERAHLLGGEAHIESEPGAGTRVEVVLPL